MKTSDTAGAAGSSMQEQLWNEILSYPEKALCRTMGARHLASFLNKADSNIRPEMEESSVFTIRLPGQNTTVKLLSASGIFILYLPQKGALHPQSGSDPMVQTESRRTFPEGSG